MCRKFPELIPEESLTNVPPLVKRLFTGKIPNLQLAGRLAHFSKNWEKLTQDQEILSVVKGYVIPFLKISVKRTIPKEVATSKTQELLIDQEITKMLDKGAISKVEHQFPGQFLSNILLVKKKGWGKSSLYKLKSSQQVYSIQAFQNGRFALFEIPSREKRFSLQDRIKENKKLLQRFFVYI